MSSFKMYLDPAVSLDDRLDEAFKELNIEELRRREIFSFLAVLKIKDVATYEHSIRVGLLTRAIARFMHLNQKTGFYAGVLHDVGKAQTNPKTLKKTESWTPADTEEIKFHVMDGYRLIRGHFDFSAEVILWHHRFQPNSYPAEVPENLHEYSQGTKIMIPFYGRILAVADQFDATHRVNDKFTAGGSSVGGWVKECMLKHNPDQRELIEELYEADIFTTRIFEDETQAVAEAVA